MTQALLLKLMAAAAITGALTLAWWGWQTADASMLLLGTQLC